MYEEFEHITFTNFDRLEGADIDMSIIHMPNENTDDYIFLDHYSNKDINILDELASINTVERYIYIDYDFFIKDIRKSFKNREDIINQFSLDMPRCSIYINGIKVMKYQEFIDFIEYRFPSEFENILMLSTQALFGLPFQILHDYLMNMDNH